MGLRENSGRDGGLRNPIGDPLGRGGKKSGRVKMHLLGTQILREDS